MSRWIIRHREWLLLPLFMGISVLAIHGCYWLTGRGPLDDPGELVALGYRAIRLAVVIAMTAFVQEHLFGFRGEREEATFWDDFLDSCVSLALLWLFSGLLWR